MTISTDRLYRAAFHITEIKSTGSFLLGNSVSRPSPLLGHMSSYQWMVDTERFYIQFLWYTDRQTDRKTDIQSFVNSVQTFYVKIL